MRIELPSGTPAELVKPEGEATLGVVDRARHLRAPTAVRRHLREAVDRARLGGVRSRAVPGSHAGRRRRALRRGAATSTTTGCSATSSRPATPRERDDVCAHRVLHGRHVRAQGGGALALPPRRCLLRDDPDSRRVEGVRTRPSRSTSSRTPSRRRRSRSSASTIRTRRRRMSPRSSAHAGDRRALPRGRARVRARSRSSRPSPRGRGRRLAEGDRLHERLNVCDPVSATVAPGAPG